METTFSVSTPFKRDNICKCDLILHIHQCTDIFQISFYWIFIIYIRAEKNGLRFVQICCIRIPCAWQLSRDKNSTNFVTDITLAKYKRECASLNLWKAFVKVWYCFFILLWNFHATKCSQRTVLFCLAKASLAWKLACLTSFTRGIRSTAGLMIALIFL